MIIKRKTLLVVSLSILIVSTIFLVVFFTTFYIPKIRSTDNIVIWNDADFKNYKFGGKGTESNPYLIENLFITTESDVGIYILHTTKYFIIRNCFVGAIKKGIFIDHVADNTAIISYNTLEKNSESGIYITNSDYVQILNNTLIKNWDGITIEDSQSTILQNNYCEDNRNRGIFIYNSIKTYVEGSVCINNRYGGIISENSPSTTLVENICKDSPSYEIGWPIDSEENGGFGVFLKNSPNSNITKNELTNNYDSNILVVLSENLTVLDNTLLKGGLFFESKTNQYLPIHNQLKYTSANYFLSFTIEGNSVNDKPLSFYTNFHNEIINSTNNGQMIFANCSNLLLENLNIFDGSGIALYFCENATINNSSISSMSRNGLSLFSTQESTIINNSFYNNSVDGIVLYNSNYTTISNNSCFDNGDDGFATMYSGYNNLTKNIIYNNVDTGMTIVLTDYYILINNTIFNNKKDGLTLFLSTNTVVTSNIIRNNNFDGILLEDCLYSFITNNSIFDNHVNGISFRSSSFNILVNNSITDNLGSGIRFYLVINQAISVNNSIYENFIENNRYHGVAIGYGSYNLIHHNNFTNNNIGGSSQGYDSGSDNIWYDIISSEGNFWSDYVEPGTYSIDGSANSEDLYPL